MKLFVGTSGYSYKEWKGSFYPEKLPQKEMLRYYAERFLTCEINNTFYRMPKASVLESWAEQVPPEFRFVLKASQLITHRKRLKDVAENTEHFFKMAAALKDRKGPLLFQLPPNLKKDVPRFEEFLKLTPGQPLIVFEFRHESWLDEEVFALLRANRCGLCVADADDLPAPSILGTTGWGYLRLRREAYTDDELRAWITKIKNEPWEEAYIFFKHEDSGTGPELAARFLKLAQA